MSIRFNRGVGFKPQGTRKLRLDSSDIDRVYVQELEKFLSMEIRPFIYRRISIASGNVAFEEVERDWQLQAITSQLKLLMARSPWRTRASVATRFRVGLIHLPGCGPRRF